MGKKKRNFHPYSQRTYSAELKFDLAKANAFVRSDYREGWKIPGLG